MNKCAVLNNAILTAVFDANARKGEEPGLPLDIICMYLRHAAEFVEQNGDRLSPASFGTYEALRGAYDQWNVMRETGRLCNGAAR